MLLFSCSSWYWVKKIKIDACVCRLKLFDHHKIKDEVFYIREGKLLVKYGLDEDLSKAEEVILEKGDNFYVKTGLNHQMIGLEDTEMFEFSTQHFDSDSYRLEKGD